LHSLTQFSAFTKSLRRYFKAYGGWTSIFLSPIFLFSMLISLLDYSNWIDPKWASRSFDMIPSLLGFSLGSYTILFSLMTGRLKKALRAVKNQKGISYLDEVNATFFHFIFVQILCIIWAFLFEGSYVIDIYRACIEPMGAPIFALTALILTGSFIGHFLLVYSFLLILAAALAVYRIASIVDPADG
jgi:membrane-associated phospholipid phosphatase